jgi:hypothetical protein
MVSIRNIREFLNSREQISFSNAPQCDCQDDCGWLLHLAEAALPRRAGKPCRSGVCATLLGGVAQGIAPEFATGRHLRRPLIGAANVERRNAHGRKSEHDDGGRL